MKQTATVKRLLGAGHAEIMVLRQSACGHDCEHCGGCSGASAPQVLVTAENSVGARPGDQVLVESEGQKVLGLAAVLYLLPFLLLFAGYLVGAGPLGLGEGGAAALGICALALGLGICILLDRRLRRRGGLVFRITEVTRACSDM